MVKDDVDISVFNIFGLFDMCASPGGWSPPQLFPNIYFATLLFANTCPKKHSFLGPSFFVNFRKMSPKTTPKRRPKGYPRRVFSTRGRTLFLNNPPMNLLDFQGSDSSRIRIKSLKILYLETEPVFSRQFLFFMILASCVSRGKSEMRLANSVAEGLYGKMP